MVPHSLSTEVGVTIKSWGPLGGILGGRGGIYSAARMKSRVS